VAAFAFEFDEEIARGWDGFGREAQIAGFARADAYAFVRQEFGVAFAPDL
jgi:hypothetical protein